MSQYRDTRKKLAEQKAKPVKPPQDFKAKAEELRKRLKEKRE